MDQRLGHQLGLCFSLLVNDSIITFVLKNDIISQKEKQRKDAVKEGRQAVNDSGEFQCVTSHFLFHANYFAFTCTDLFGLCSDSGCMKLRHFEQLLTFPHPAVPDDIPSLGEFFLYELLNIVVT